MSRGKTTNVLAMCDTCGFVYQRSVMRLNSYGLLVCPEDFEGQYDLKNSPLKSNAQMALVFAKIVIVLTTLSVTDRNRPLWSGKRPN